MEFVREVVVTGLGTDVEISGRLADGPVNATLEVMTQFAAAMTENDVGARAAVATSASRDAENGTAVMDRLAEIIGVQPEIITGDREAVLSFAGATSGIGTT
ncbi:MAG: exopolyphosphatase, partial [Acidimicrobiia bacterium]